MKTKNDICPDLCICCGKPVPEGRMVCYACESENTPVISNASARPKKRIKRILEYLWERLNES